jgi:uncharacterized membrane protein
MVCTFVACIGFMASIVSRIASPRLATGCFAAFLVVEWFWGYWQLRKGAAKQRALSALSCTDSLASGAAEPASEPTPNGAVCYLYGILFPLLYFSSKTRERNDFLRFHCFQCLILFSILVPLMFVHDHVPWAEHLTSLIQSIWLLGWIVSMIMAGRRKMFHLPVIGALAEWLARR